MKRDVVYWGAMISVIGAMGCGSATEVVAPPAPEIPKFSCLANSQTFRLPESLRGSAFHLGSPDDSYEAISKTVPGGFAGVYLDTDRNVMTFVDTAAARRALGQIEQAFQSQAPFVPSVDFHKLSLRGARWTFAELAEWYRYIIPRVGGPDSGVSSSDIDEVANTISYGVIDETARKLLEHQLSALGVSCNLVTTHIQAYATAAVAGG
jgi:hypothetical protein